MNARWGEVPEYARRPRSESEAHEAAQASREEARWLHAGRSIRKPAKPAAQPAPARRGFLAFIWSLRGGQP